MNTKSHSHDFTFSACSETLAATIDFNTERAKPTILSLHGGGPSGRDRIAWLSHILAQNGHSVLRFDHSGQGNSTGSLKHSSMRKRRDEALAAAQFLKPHSAYTVIGTSMGGPTAIALTQHLNIKNLILFCPAAYANQAFDLDFDSGFTDVIRQPDSYRNSQIFAYMKNFSGRFLHIIGNQDDIIPSGVTELYQNHMLHSNEAQFITLPDAPHAIHKWLPQHPEQQQMVVEKILAILET